MVVPQPAARSRCRPDALRASIGRLAPLVGALALLTGSALAGDEARRHPVWGPALAAQDAAEERALRVLGVADAAAERAARGLRARLDAAPSATWSGGPGRDPGLAAAIVVTGRIDWSADPVAAANALLARHRTLVGQVEAVHRSVRAATGAYLDLRRAHVAVAQAEAAVVGRRTTFDRVESSVLGRSGPAARPGGASDVELDVARLELERALAAVERASRDLATARRHAAALGIDTVEAERVHRAVLEADPLEGWRLVPPPAHESTSVERRRIERDLALARLQRQGAWSALDDVRIEGTLAGPDARVRLGFSLDEGRPGAFLEGSLRTAARPSWGVSVRARVRIDDAWADDLERARWALDDAEAALAEALDEERWARAETDGALRDTEEDVAFAERALALGRAALRALDDERLAVAAAARAGEEGADARLARFDEAYARAVLGHLRERDAFLRAWAAYLRAAERAWVGVAAAFEVRPPDR